MFENGCYLRRQKRFKIPRSDKDSGRSRKEGRSRNNNHSSDSSADHDIKKPSLKSSDMFGGGLPPLSGPGTMAADDIGMPPTKLEKHDYKYSLHDKYGVDPGDIGGTDHLVLPAAPLGKHDHYGSDPISEDKYQTPDMSHLSPVSDLHARYALPEGLLGLRPPDPSQYSTNNPFSINRLLPPGPGSPMHPGLSKSELHYGEYSLHNHALHHESMYYSPPVYQGWPVIRSLPSSQVNSPSVTSHL
ncbi:forkhead box protein A1-A isoform X2 [Eurytemora carolleeae]|uniref:forkhead box protein A1-A isoform X2 n=1 Tax=Eurytemora carolleeae TaxID=1294199 RepID=UPI000C77EAED|nr:forkhead box protein A1-A isoform X2 [Eurytemora carolleeae]|eukprot:XP_023331889.1 forkhead box protein A1-A-like isoform X2 [Eurytemora affinis]